MLETQDLSYLLPSGQILIENINVSLSPKKIVGLLGPNGAGKTTLFSLLLGLMKPSSGSILLDNNPITALSVQKRIRLGLGYLPQDGALFQELSVLENLISLFEYQEHSKTDSTRFVLELLDQIHLGDIASRPVFVLSGGQKRRLEFGRILAMNPKYVLLDEPFSGVDPKSIEDIQNHIIQLKERNIGVFISDHNIHAITDISDEIYLLIDGKIAAHGNSHELIKNPYLRDRYFGHKISSSYLS